MDINRNLNFIEKIIPVKDIPTTFKDLLSETQELIRNGNQCIEPVNFPKELEEKIQSFVPFMSGMDSAFPFLIEEFLEDNTFRNGFVKHCIVNAFGMPINASNLSSYNVEIRKNTNKDKQRNFNYLAFGDLSADETEVKDTLNTISIAFPIIVEHLKKNNIVVIIPLIYNILILLIRLFLLYTIYGSYLDYINLPANLQFGYNLLIEIIFDLSKILDMAEIIKFIQKEN